LVEAMERHGHLALAPEVRERVLSASAATIDRLLAPAREAGGSVADAGGTDRVGQALLVMPSATLTPPWRDATSPRSSLASRRGVANRIVVF
jgi:hypothetical protein